MSSPRPHRVVHLELHTDDLPQACLAYERLLGWRAEAIRTAAGEYIALDLGGGTGGLQGGIVETPVARPLWLPYAAVPDLARATDRARELGARVLLEPRECPTGWRGVIDAGAGGPIALWQHKR